MSVRGRLRRLLVVGLVVAGCWQLGAAGWIHVKAVVAQVLIRDAWAATLRDGGEHAPWPWADTVPVARLRVPRLGVDLVALQGFSGQALAFGPGAVTLSNGVRVLSGHRDTHFQFIAGLETGDVLTLEQRDRISVAYRVVGMRVVDYRDTGVVSGATRGVLALVTCWSLNAFAPGGRLRLVVTAREESRTRST